MSTLTQFISGGGGGGIKSVQRGQTAANVTSTALDVTITAVANLSKTYLTAISGQGANATTYTTAHAYLTSTTNLRIVNSRGDSSGNSPIVAWEVVEFY